MTRCTYTETRLRALLDGELETAEHTRVLAHLESCDRCADAFAQMQCVTSMLQELPVEEVPDHFATSLQVRLARHRTERAAALKRRERFRLPLQWPRSWRLAGGLSTVVAAAALCVVLLGSGIRASEVARRAELSWSQIQNYGCVFVSKGVYQGQDRSFTQRQFYRKSGEFRLDTGQDYPLTTYVLKDRIIHYLPGGRWDGNGPLCIIRPRVDDRGALPFPFGVTWQNGGNVSLDQLIRQLNENRNAELVGEEKVGERTCYRLRLSAVPEGGTDRDQYELWVDKESFIPRRVSWYRDEQNHIVTEAQNLEVNYDVLPAGTFEFQIPAGARVIHGDVDPHLLAMPFIPARPAAFDESPTISASEEAWKRSGAVQFPVLMPERLPEGFRLVRVRRKLGRWIDAHWIRQEKDGAYQMIKLVEQDTRLEGWKQPAGAAEVNLGSKEVPQQAWLVTGTVPYAYSTLTWQRGDTRCTLFAAGLNGEEVQQIARSAAAVTAPSRPLVVERSVHRAIRSRGEPSALPTDLAAEESAEVRVTPLDGSTEPASAQPPMMPEMSDEDRGMGQPTAPVSSREGAVPGTAAVK